jgi:hypothetical protein
MAAVRTPNLNINQFSFFQRPYLDPKLVNMESKVASITPHATKKQKISSRPDDGGSTDL